MFRFSLLLLWFAQTPQTAQLELRIEAPLGLAAEKARMESADFKLEALMPLVGLKRGGPPIDVELASESSDLARSVSPWIAGFALRETVVIFPSRSPSYPDNTLDDVVRHEVAHVLIWRASSGRPIPRWFNEGLATAAERHQGFRDQTQLFLYLVSGSRLSFDELDHLFEGGQADQTRAYLLSGALVQDLLREYGETMGGRILDLVGKGHSFETAFTDVTGQSTAEAEAEFWKHQRAWTTWIQILFSQETLWIGITLLAIFAIWRRRRRNAEMRRRWEKEEPEDEV